MIRNSEERLRKLEKSIEDTAKPEPANPYSVGSGLPDFTSATKDLHSRLLTMAIAMLAIYIILIILVVIGVLYLKRYRGR